MSFKGTVEIFVHFNQFKNIDLYHQGVYQLKCYLYQDNPPQQGQPYMSVEEKKLINLFKPNHEFTIQPSRIFDTFFFSKAFIVKYCEQQIDLNEGCVFRIELDAYPTMEQHNIYLIVELLFCEQSIVTQENFKSEQLQMYQKCVAKFQSRLHNINFIREFVPCMFDDMHFCLLKVMVHSIIVDFKYVQLSQTFHEFLQKITQNFDPRLVSEFYHGYNRSLRRFEEHFIRYYLSTIKECLEDEHIRKKYLQIQQLKKEDPQIDLSNIPQDKAQQEEFANRLLVDIKQTSAQLFLTWYQLIDAFNYIIRPLIHKLQKEYLIKIKDRWGESIFQNTQTVADLSFLESQAGKSHKAVAKQIRSNSHFQQLEPLNIEDLDLFPEAKVHPIVFKDVSQTQQTLSNKIKGLHLFVFVHGYQGNSNDMRIWKNNLLVRYPDHLTLMSVANEDSTEQDIYFMGARLADEVKRWIKEWCPKENFAKLSFVGHSLGGLIIRAALPNLEKYKGKLYTYISLGTPHLGYQNSSSRVVDTGLWLIRKWKKCVCLNQLTMNDASDPEQTCLFKLSKEEGLGWFQNVILVSSYQDTYSPFESARIQRPSKSQKSEGAKVLNRMIDNIMGKMKQQKLERLDVNYELPGKGVDALIGRAAHIAFLENSPLIRLTIYSFDEWFE